jgi:ATP-binding cassette subfamily A (ABC1) protein 3
MLIYSGIYFLLAIYVERVNPGEFGIPQPWNYLFKKSYWKPQATSAIQPFDSVERPPSKKNGTVSNNHWIEMSSIMGMKSPSVTVSHVTKVSKLISILDL